MKSSTRRWIVALVVLAALAGARSAPAAPIDPQAIPEALRSWIPWVLHERTEPHCPFLHGDRDTHRCAWAGPLHLTLTAHGGSFSQTWTVYQRSAAPLPGDDKHWPQAVQAGGKAHAVVARGGTPHLQLEPGVYPLTGQFTWDSLPDSLPIPTATGMVGLTLEGRNLAFPQRDDTGRLWLQQGSGGDTTAEEALTIRVFRHLSDEIPLQLTTQLVLDVAGKDREVVFAAPLPTGFLPLALQSPLPARLDPDGRLRVQLRRGEWTLSLTARSTAPLSAITVAEQSDALWAAEEVWVFAAHPELRLASLEGVTSIDPQQTELPTLWKQLPAYRVTPGAALQLVERRRGNSDPAADQLHLARQLWLDFNGGGYTVRDHVTGTMRRGWRLEVNRPLQLGHVASAGADQLITRLTADGPDGVEIRDAELSLQADSRLTGKIRKLPAVGWNHDFQSVHAVLHLPPGWRLWATTGVDHVPQTWVNRWNLLDLFLLLITTLALAKLWTPRWGAIAFVTFGLTFPESGAPKWLWLALVAGIALLRVLQIGWVRDVLRVYRGVVFVALLGCALPFMVQHLRTGIYPALEQPYTTLDGTLPAPQPMAPGRYDNVNAPPATTGATKPDDEERDTYDAKAEIQAAPEPTPLVEQQAVGGASDRSSSAYRGLGTKEGNYSNLQQKKQALYAYRAGTKIQTGPGLPGWSWDQIQLQWSGPVEASQQIGLWLTAPTCNLIFAVLRVLLLAFLLLRALDITLAALSHWVTTRPAVAAWWLAALGAGALAHHSAYAADFPPDDLLDDLQQRLLAAPNCAPECAAIAKLAIEAVGDTLRVRLEAHAQSAVAIPLPGGRESWTPQRVTLDTVTEPPLQRADNGVLWLALEPGVHQVLLEGPLPPRDTIPLALPLRPYRIDVTASNWAVSGIHDDGSVEDSLQLTRQQPLAGHEAATAQPTMQLPPFLAVERELTLGLQWEVETRVRRLSPAGTPVTIEVPLLAGESITTADITVRDGKAAVTLGATAHELSWRSVLESQQALTLTAPETTTWVEQWRIEASPLWHVAFDGIPALYPQQPSEASIPTFRPWPGESITLAISRPEGISGETLTIDRATLLLRPDLRSTENTLTLSLRSSLGGQHDLTLPASAKLQTVTIDGAGQPIQLDDRRLTIPVTPGPHTAQVVWRDSHGIATFYHVPPIDLGAVGVNADVQVHMPGTRWVLLLCGPRVGPAILFWSYLGVLLLVAFGLGRVTLTPLRTLQWFLLGIGLSQASIWASFVVVGWLLALGYRARQHNDQPLWFNTRQVLLGWWSLIALGLLFMTIQQGLLGTPDMQIAGNGSSNTFLHWFQDRTDGHLLPRPWVLSIPRIFYSLAMLAWALWLAASLIKWLRWGWTSFTAGGAWHTGTPRTRQTTG
ncbi:MAG: hypothetical protein HY696_09485 [Deltaproteobacteria bacterium]|nr:hypothetical protein [Deltaproteobacteria bacterium]